MTTVRLYAEKFVRWEWLALLLLLAVALLPNSPTRLLLLLLPSIWIVHWIAQGRILPSTPFNLSVGLMVVMTLITLLFTFDPDTSLPKLTIFLIGIALFGAATYLSRSRANGIWYVYTFLVAAGTTMALVGLIGTPWTGPFAPLNLIRTSLPDALQTVPGAIGGVVNANELAGTLVSVAPVMVAGLLGLRRLLWRHHRWWYVALVASTALVIGVLIATQSRGGMLGLLGGIFLMLLLMVRSRWRIVLAILIGVLAISTLLSVRSVPQSGDVFGDTLGLDSRIEIWERGLEAISDYPVTGVSFNGFRRVIHVLYPTFLVPEQIDLAHAHNHLLQVALDLGIPGLIGYLSLWLLSGVLIWEAMRRLRRSRSSDHPYFAILAGLAGSMTAVWLFGMFDAVALGARPSFIWWLLLALIASLHFTVKVNPPGFFRRRRRYRSEPTAERESALQPSRPRLATPPADGSRPRIRYRRPLQPDLIDTLSKHHTIWSWLRDNSESRQSKKLS